MKYTSLRGIYLLAAPVLCLLPAGAVAQNSIFDNPQTNIFQIPTNTLPLQSVGPSSSGSSALFSGPFMGTTSLAGSLAAMYVPTGPGIWEAGPLALYPHLRDELTYGNGVQAQPGVNSTTLVNTVAPGMFFKLGSHWSLDYTPSLSFYSNPAFRDTTDQNVMLIGSTTYRDWSFFLTQSYINTTQPLVETGTQLGQEAYATAFNAAWQTGSKTTLQLGLNQNFRFTGDLGSLHEWTTTDWYNYQFQPQFSAALGASFGYDELRLSSDMPYEQALGRVIFQPGTKLRLMVIGGLEDRQFVHPDASAEITPIFQVMGMYQAREGTLLTVSGNRTVVPSLFQNEVNLITTVTLNLKQKIIGAAYWDLSAGYTDQTYSTIVRGQVSTNLITNLTLPGHTEIRGDSRAYAKIALTTVIHSRLTASIFYLYIDNASNLGNFKYTGNQGGLELIYRY